MSAIVLVPFKWSTAKRLLEINAYGQGYELAYGNPTKYLRLEEMGNDAIQTAHAQAALQKSYSPNDDWPGPPLAAA